jgi:hypothetical protein
MQVTAGQVRRQRWRSVASTSAVLVIPCAPVPLGRDDAVARSVMQVPCAALAA